MLDNVQVVSGSKFADSVIAAAEAASATKQDDSLNNLRRAALSAFSRLGVPTSKDEDWKYTSLAELSRKEYKVVANTRQRSENLENQAFNTLSNSQKIICRNTADGLSVDIKAELQDGVSLLSIESIFSALESPQTTAIKQAVEAHLARYAEHDNHSFSALNAALFQSGYVLHIARDTIVNSPIELIHYSGKEAQGNLNNIRNLIVVEENAQVEVLERYAGEDSVDYVNNVVTEVFCAKNSVVVHHKLQLEGKAAYHLAKLAVKQEDGSNFTSNMFAFGSKLSRNEISPVLDGERIETHLNGLSVLGGKQHVDNFTVIDHAKPNSFSREVYKGIYREQSRGVFAGTIIVRQDAQKTNAIQSNQTLLLSDEASIDSRPQLKIWADDVKCTHGATIGQLDKHALFYLRSRGIKEELARDILLHAFASDIIRLVTNEELKAELEKLLLSTETLEANS